MATSIDQQTELLALYHFFKESGDERRTGQTYSLINKLKSGRFSICFSGHFSAGKSSLINALMEDDILPTSPIPTSANIIRIHYGEPSIKIFLKNGRRLELAPPFDFEQIKTLGKNGQEIMELEISVDSGLPSGLEWVDTPGIDSTDPLHMQATEDAVLGADACFYVVDYNHVQASENYHFLLAIQKMGKPFHLIVSQIDKHQEAELSFKDYARSVEQSLEAWGLKPESLHYITIKNPLHPMNEWDDLKTYLKDLSIKQEGDAVQDGVLKRLADDHIDWWRKTHQEELDNLKQKIDSDETLSSLYEKKIIHRSCASNIGR